MNIECTQGTFAAFAWHVGKHVAADPSDFNWRIDCEDVDLAINALERPGSNVAFHDNRVIVTMSNLPDKVIIHAGDTRLENHPGCLAVLTGEGRRQFLGVLQSVADRECIAEMSNVYVSDNAPDGGG